MCVTPTHEHLHTNFALLILRRLLESVFSLWFRHLSKQFRIHVLQFESGPFLCDSTLQHLFMMCLAFDCLFETFSYEKIAQYVQHTSNWSSTLVGILKCHYSDAISSHPIMIQFHLLIKSDHRSREIILPNNLITQSILFHRRLVYPLSLFKFSKIDYVVIFHSCKQFKYFKK